MGDFPRNASRLSRIKMAEDVGKDACIRFTAESEFKELNEQMSQLKRAICLRTWGTQYTFVFYSEVVGYLQLYTGKKRSVKLCLRLVLKSVFVVEKYTVVLTDVFNTFRWIAIACSVHHAETRLQHFIPAWRHLTLFGKEKP